MANIRLIKGDSSSVYNVKHEGVVDYTDYTGTLVLLDKKNTEVLRKEVTAHLTDGLSFSLAPVDTEGLTPGIYSLGFEIRKTVGGAVTFRRELHYTLELQKSIVD